MATADEIRRWQIGVTVPKQETDVEWAELFFLEPLQPSDKPYTKYRRCAGEQRVIVETEIAAQLAELNDVLRQIRDVIRDKRVAARRRITPRRTRRRSL